MTAEMIAVTVISFMKKYAVTACLLQNKAYCDIFNPVYDHVMLNTGIFVSLLAENSIDHCSRAGMEPRPYGLVQAGVESRLYGFACHPERSKGSSSKRVHPCFWDETQLLHYIGFPLFTRCEGGLLMSPISFWMQSMNPCDCLEALGRVFYVPGLFQTPGKKSYCIWILATKKAMTATRGEITRVYSTKTHLYVVGFSCSLFSGLSLQTIEPGEQGEKSKGTGRLLLYIRHDSINK